MSHICASRADGVGRLSMSNLDKTNEYNHFDFAEQVRADFKGLKHLIYIEANQDTGVLNKQFVFIHIKDEQVLFDKILSAEELKQEVAILVSGHEYAESNKKKSSDLNGINIIAYEINKSFLTDFASSIGAKAPRFIEQPISKTIVPVDQFRFRKAEQLKERLSPNGMVKRWAPIILIIGICSAGLQYWSNSNEVATQQNVVKDDWAKYRKLMTKTSPQAANRFSQDFNNLRAFNATLTGWRVTEVIHSKKQDLLYKLANEGGYTQTLTTTVEAISKKFGIAMVNDLTKQGDVISVKGANVPPYQEGKSERWDLRRLHQTFVDDLAIFIPTAAVRFLNYETPDKTSKVWRAMKVQVVLKNNTIDDLLKLASVTKGKPITMLFGSYRISDNTINGSFTLVLSGEDKW